jgi:arylamine N-acetyltransferase
MALVPGTRLGPYEVVGRETTSAFWRPDARVVTAGRQLAYISDTHNLVVVEMNEQQDRMEIGRSQLLFGGHPLPVLPGFDASGEAGTPVYLA